LGALWQRRNRADEALNNFTRAIEIRRKLVELAPGDPEPKRMLANTLMNRALLGKDRDLIHAPPGADKANQSQIREKLLVDMAEAQSIRQSLLEHGTRDPGLRHDTATGYYNMFL